jgi:hypothetical protein
MKGRRISSGTLVLGGVELPPVPELPSQHHNWEYRGVGFGDAYVDYPADTVRGPVDPHPDLYLEAAQLDDLDTAAVIDFMNDYGVPTVNPLWSGRWRMAHSDAEPPRLIGLPTVDPSLAGQIRRAPMPAAGDYAAYGIAPRIAVRAGLQTIRFLVESWSHLGEDGPPPSEPMLALGADHPTRFARVLDSCLAPLCPRAFGITHSAEIPEWTVAFDEPPPLLAVLALQLAHHIDRGADWSHCANERCKHPRFEYQRNRHQKDPTRRRSGARYCSDQCADAARQRRSKARRRRAA